MLRCEPTTTERLDEAFAVLLLTATWLTEQGLHQRVGGTTRTAYDAWQDRGENFVVLEDDAVVGVFSLCRQKMNDWPDVFREREVLCLRALATHPEYRNKDVGRFAVRQAIALSDGEPVYLDCVAGFLPKFYASIGFKQIASQVLAEGGYDVRLMRHGSAES